MADIKRFEPVNEHGKEWCWVFWYCEVPISAISGAAPAVCTSVSASKAPTACFTASALATAT